jgi:dephospho-CoA kinase
MIFVALTGSIGSGKSTVSAIFEQLGAIVLDSDKMARQIVEPGERAYHLIVRHFGVDILDDKQQIIRKKLARIVFANREQLTILNGITHPEIDLLRQQKIKDIFTHNPQSLVINDIPLVFENNLEDQFQAIIVLKIDHDTQIKRLMRDRKMALEEIENRIKNQLPQKEKFVRANWIIDNNGTLRNTEKQIKQIYEQCLKLPHLSIQQILKPT